MDVLAIILACSLHPDDALVRALVDVQSGGNVYFVGDLSTLKTNDSLTSADAALRFAENIKRLGGRPAVGLLGIPLDWAARYGRAPVELFDGCTNVAIATAAFAEYRDRCSGVAPGGPHPRGKRHAPRRRASYSTTLRFCVLSTFARDLGLASAPAAILGRLAPLQGPSTAATADPPPERSLVFVDGDESGTTSSAPRTRSRIFLDPQVRAAEPR